MRVDRKDVHNLHDVIELYILVLIIALDQYNGLISYQIPPPRLIKHGITAYAAI